MFRRGPIVFSPCEVDWLKANRHERSINEASLYLSKSRNAINRKLDELDGKPLPKKKNKISRIGKRDDIIKDGKPQFFRSSWEANVARWLNHKEKEWTYEPDVFPFFEFGIRNGTTSYCPDFLYGKTDLYLEVKGMLDQRGRTAINRFRKFYPNEFKRLRAIVGRPNTVADKFFKKIGVPIIGYMNELTKKYKDEVSNWE